MCFSKKPIKIDDFNEAEEIEVKEHVKKRKIKRREIAEKNKLTKKKKKQEENKKTQKEMWNRLKDLNQGFKDIKEYIYIKKKIQKNVKNNT